MSYFSRKCFCYFYEIVLLVPAKIKVYDWLRFLLNMDLSNNTDNSARSKTPKKRAPVKRTASILWSEKHPEETNDVNLLQLVKQLQKRLSSLEQEWQDLLEHLSLHEASEEDTEVWEN